MRTPYYCLAFLALFTLTSTALHAQCDSVDLALGRPAAASSDQDGNANAFDPKFAFDGDTTASRWSSAFTDNEYIYVDLQAAYNLCLVRIYWEAAYASSYAIEATNDTTAGWTVLQTITGNTTLINTISVSGLGSGPYRFVRMRGITRATTFGYSMFEMQVFGFPPACNPVNAAIGMGVSSSSDESGAFPASTVTDGDLNTRWASGFSDNESITVNLGSVTPLCRTTLQWYGNTYPTNFAIDLSNDGTNFTQNVLITGNETNYNVINLTGSGQYIRMRGITRNNTGVGYSLEEFGVNVVTTLPVKLTNFTAAENNGKVRLTWTTQLESNSSYFDVERSTDGASYTAIGRVKAAGNSSNPLNYEYNDATPFKGKNYYRLKQVDLDGKSEYSLIVTVLIGNTIGGLSLYPNPANDVVNIVNNSGVMIREIRIFNSAGVAVRRFIPLANNSTIQLPISELSKGIYILKVVTSKGTEILKVLK